MLLLLLKPYTGTNLTFTQVAEVTTLADNTPTGTILSPPPAIALQNGTGLIWTTDTGGGGGA